MSPTWVTASQKTYLAGSANIIPVLRYHANLLMQIPFITQGASAIEELPDLQTQSKYSQCQGQANNHQEQKQANPTQKALSQDSETHADKKLAFH